MSDKTQTVRTGRLEPRMRYFPGEATPFMRFIAYIPFCIDFNQQLNITGERRGRLVHICEPEREPCCSDLA